jgi:hypothetical protein
MADTPRNLESEALDVVMLGSFNPAILHPQWFLRQHLIGEEEAVSASIKVVATEVADVSFGGVHVVCLNHSLMLNIQNIAYTTTVFDLIDGILNLLPHTPMRACGINPSAHYRVETVDYWHKIGHALAPKDQIWTPLFDKPGLQSLIIKSPRTGEYPGAINITVEPSSLVNPGLFVKTNTHFDVPDDMQESGGAEAIRKFVKHESATACEQARRVGTRIFSEIKPDG